MHQALQGLSLHVYVSDRLVYTYRHMHCRFCIGGDIYHVGSVERCRVDIIQSLSLWMLGGGRKGTLLSEISTSFSFCAPFCEAILAICKTSLPDIQCIDGFSFNTSIDLTWSRAFNSLRATNIGLWRRIPALSKLDQTITVPMSAAIAPDVAKQVFTFICSEYAILSRVWRVLIILWNRLRVEGVSKCV